MDRRHFISAGAAAGLASLAASGPAQSTGPGRIVLLGISASPRRGKTTATAVQAALDAAKTVDPRLETRLIDLGGMTIPGWSGSPDGGGPNDFTAKVKNALLDPDLGGLIIGSPSYFRSMSALCKAFLEQLAALRKPRLVLAGLPVGALCVGGYRNGGQELVIEQILTAMLCHEAVAVGGRSPALQGATLWNSAGDDITQDELGMASARNLGLRVAQAAIQLKG